MRKFSYILFITIVLSISIFYSENIRGEYRNNDLIGVKYTIKKKDNFIKILRRAGLEKNVRDSIILVLNKEVDLKKCMPGEEVFIFTDGEMNFKKLEYKKDISTTYIVEYNKKYNAYMKKPEKKIHIDFVSGTVHTNMYKSLMKINEEPDLAQKFASIFAWEFDCNKDLRSGDQFEMLIEKVYINEKFFQYGRIIYASYKTKDHLYEAFYFNENYYDRDGKSLQGSLMRAPIAYYTRISSGFTQKRFHPVMKKYMPHLAIDYAAPRGTPVLAAGDGEISKKFYDRYGGKIVYIKHANGYETEYMHLLSYTNKVKKGRFVHQGDTIGFVGKSGQTTGYHLHYAVKYNGVYINPRRMKFNRINNISDEDLQIFYSYADMIYDLISSIKSYKNFPYFFSKKTFLFEYANTFNQSTCL